MNKNASLKKSGVEKATAGFKKAKKAVVGLASAATMALAMAVPASAANITVNQNMTTADVVGGILGVVFEILMYLGIILAIIGVGQFIYSYKDQNSEAQGNGLRLALIGAVLFGLKFLVAGLGWISVS